MANMLTTRAGTVLVLTKDVKSVKLDYLNIVNSASPYRIIGVDGNGDLVFGDPRDFGYTVTEASATFVPPLNVPYPVTPASRSPFIGSTEAVIVGGMRSFGPFSTTLTPGRTDNVSHIFATDTFTNNVSPFTSIASQNGADEYSEMTAIPIGVGLGGYLFSGRYLNVTSPTNVGKNPSTTLSTVYTTNSLFASFVGASAGSPTYGTFGQLFRQQTRCTSMTGHASPVAGFICGGYTSDTPAAPFVEGRPLSVTMQKFSFFSTSGVPAHTAGETMVLTPTDPQSSPISNLSTTFVGNLKTGVAEVASLNSVTTGYMCGGVTSSPSFMATTTVSSFPLAIETGTNSTIGNLNVVRRGASAIQSFTNGYIVGGKSDGVTPFYTTMETMPFAVPNTFSVVNSFLTTGLAYGVGYGSETNGYIAGGKKTDVASGPAPTVASNSVLKFSFASATTTTSVASLTYPVAFACALVH